MGDRLQSFPAALIARIPDPGRLCRDHRRNRLQRYATWKLRVSAGCSHRTIWHIKNRRGSNRSRIKVQWHVNVPEVQDQHAALLASQVVRILQAGLADATLPGVGDPEATAMAILNATTRFHHPDLVAAGGPPAVQLKGLEAVISLIMPSLTASR